MTIKTIEVEGFGPAIRAMRNPLNSWSRSDTHQGKVGEKDRELSEKLAKAGPEHAKHLRMIMVWAEIIAPRFWFVEFDTYRAGVEKISCSTMHKLTDHPLTLEDFEQVEDYWPAELSTAISAINARMEAWKTEQDQHKKALLWQEMINLLPQSYLQRRTVMMSYAALRNMIHQRQNHKLPQWHLFVDWARTLPESWMLFEEGAFNDLS